MVSVAIEAATRALEVVRTFWTTKGQETAGSFHHQCSPMPAGVASTRICKERRGEYQRGTSPYVSLKPLRA